MHRVFKKSYSKEALAIWLNALEKPWEPHFAANSLALARDIYRNSQIRSLSIEPESMTVSVKIEKEEYYAVVELKKNRFFVRGSNRSSLFNEALGLAAIYELEELITSEAEMFLEDVSSSLTPVELPKEQKSELSRGLILQFSIQNQRLWLTPFWESSTGNRSSVITSPPQTLKERELFIQLSQKANKNQFKLHVSKNAYILQYLDGLPHFFSQELPSWSFAKITLPSCIKNVSSPSLLKVNLVAKEEGVSSFKAHLELYVENHSKLKKVSKNEQAFLLKNRHKPFVLSKKYGLIQLGNAFRQDGILDTYIQNTSFPLYMLCSLYAREHMVLSEALSSWKNQIVATISQEEAHNLPSFLRPYQRAGVLFLRHMLRCGCHSLLADEMGLGKTLQVLSLIHTYRQKQKPQLIVCPASVIGVWQAQAKEFFPDIKIQVVSPKTNLLQEDVLYVISYAQLRRQKRILDCDFEYAIIDEAQFIKNFSSKTAQACFAIKADHRIALSGTPLENHVQDLWSIFHFLMPGLLGKQKNFQSLYDKDSASALSRLKEQIKPFILRRTKSMVVPELPQKIQSVLLCPLNEFQSKLYTHYCQEAKLSLSDNLESSLNKNAFGVLTLLMRLRQACCDPSIIHGVSTSTIGGKLTVLLETLPEILENGHKVIIFSQFTTLLSVFKKHIAARFPSTNIWLLTGKTKNREKIVQAFQEKDGSGIFLISLKAGGTGITLHAADYVFLLDPWWNPAVEAQAIDRVHRIGQKNSVFVYRLITPGTIEERIQELQASKSKLADTVLEEAKALELLSSKYESLSKLIQYEP